MGSAPVSQCTSQHRTCGIFLVVRSALFLAKPVACIAAVIVGIVLLLPICRAASEFVGRDDIYPNSDGTYNVFEDGAVSVQAAPIRVCFLLSSAGCGCLDVFYNL